MVFPTRALVLHPSTQACRVLVVTDRIDLENQLAHNFRISGAFGPAIATKKEGEKAKEAVVRAVRQRVRWIWPQLDVWRARRMHVLPCTHVSGKRNVCISAGAMR
ncbi:MAG: hypothetical protein ACRYGA_14405 [Janthinobacterium lividum]